jgi:hypothetical protein
MMSETAQGLDGHLGVNDNPPLYVPQTTIYAPDGSPADLRTDDEKRLAASTSTRQRRRRLAMKTIDRKLSETGLPRKYRHGIVRRFTREFQGKVKINDGNRDGS